MNDRAKALLRVLRERLLRSRRSRDARDRSTKGIHVNGLCGVYGTLCSECHKEEYDLLLQWAIDSGIDKPLPGESHSHYWRRVEGPFMDAWHDVAGEMIRREFPE